MLGTQLGYIKKNAEADLLVFDYKAYTPMNEKNVFGHLFYGVFPGIKPEMVISHGKVIIEDYQFKNDYQDKYILAIKEANRLWKRLKKDGKDYEFKY
jgi:cytosine/adenosine deaminase-related metal-dependent hydrolase